VEECQSGIDDERVARLEREALTLKRVGEDVLRISEKVDDERSAREEHVGAVRSDLDAVKAKDTAEADAFESLVLSDLAAIKNALNEEKRERVGEDERIVGALNAYARVTQESLKLVNRSDDA
jgi:predicted RND superfamily exporter protein